MRAEQVGTSRRFGDTSLGDLVGYISQWPGFQSKSHHLGVVGLGKVFEWEGLVSQGESSQRP